MARKIKKGDKVLFYGRILYVTDLIESKDSAGKPVQIVKIDSQEEEVLESRKKVLALRKEQSQLKPEQKAKHSSLDRQIKELSEKASKQIYRFGLRADLLSYWDERGVWVSEGRVLSDDQKKKWRKVTGSKVNRVPNQKEVLALLEPQS